MFIMWMPKTIITLLWLVFNNGLILQWLCKVILNGINYWPIAYTTICSVSYGIIATSQVSYQTSLIGINADITWVYVNGGGYTINIISIGY